MNIAVILNQTWTLRASWNNLVGIFFKYICYTGIWCLVSKLTTAYLTHTCLSICRTISNLSLSFFSYNHKNNREKTGRHPTSVPLWLKITTHSHTLGVLGLGLRRVFSGGVMFRLFSVLKLFSDRHTLWMENSFLQGKGSECWRGLGIHLW